MLTRGLPGNAGSGVLFSFRYSFIAKNASINIRAMDKMMQIINRYISVWPPQ